MSRMSAIIVLIGLLIAGVAYDRVEIAPEPPVRLQPPARVSPAIQVGTPLSNVWYCPAGGGNVEEGGLGQHTLRISNLGTDAAVAHIQLLNEAGPGAEVRIEIGPHSTEDFDVNSVDTSRIVGAVVEIVGGQGVVSHAIETVQGTVGGTCGSDTSDELYFADGLTTRDATNQLVLLNPFSTDVVFSVSFQTPTRTRRPEQLQSAVVPARSVRLIDVSEHVSREATVSTSITTVQGRLAVERLVMTDGALGPVGAALTLAVDEPQTQWHFPAGRVHSDGDHRLTLFNPNIGPAEVDIEFALPDPTDRASYGLIPLEVTVPGGRMVTVDLAEEFARTELPMPLDVGISIRATNDVTFIAERWQVTPLVDTSLIGAGGTNAAVSPVLPGARSAGFPQQDGIDVESPENEILDPAFADDMMTAEQETALTGLGVSRGSSTLATSWVVPYVPFGDDATPVVAMTSVEGASVRIYAMVAGELLPPQRMTVPADGVAYVRLSSPVAGAPVVIVADAPIAAEVQTVSASLHLDVIPAVPMWDHSNVGS